MKAIFKVVGFISLFTLVLLYCVKSVYSLKDSKNQYNILQPQYSSLLEKHKTLKLELDSLQYKVKGIREATLNKEVLDERVKTMVNYKNHNELVVTN